MKHLTSSFLFLLFLLILFKYPIHAQILTDSNLPIVVINTDLDPNTGQPQIIPDEPKIPATMKIIYHPDGSRNYLSDINNPEFLNYDGRIGIEIRGTTSQAPDKKPYALHTLKDDDSTKYNVEILGLPKENDWILNSFAFDPSLLRDVLSYNLSRKMGNWASNCVYCELMVNDDYKGLYIFSEKIKIDKNRVNLVKLTTTDNEPPEVTGGYISKADKQTGGDPIAWEMPSYTGPYNMVYYIHDQPKPDIITNDQHIYIRNYFFAFQEAMDNGNNSLINGYPSMIDVPSFIDFMISNELASNVDAYLFSTFFHKDRSGKLRAGPIWDFNLTYGNDLIVWGLDRSKTDVWQFDYCNRGSKFWQDLFDDSTFNCYLTKRWHELTAPGCPLNYLMIKTQIIEIVELIAEAVLRENLRWGNIGNYAQNINDLRIWLQERIAWLNENLTNYQNCADPEIPALVINKIHYHPKSESGFDDNDLEFIEIINYSNETVDLTGIYLRELGISYNFPNNSYVNAYEYIRLASNADIFEQFHGFPPFGQYTRNLSNKTQKLLLCDAFGNVIDEVQYSDSSPWPEEADGHGPYLSLINPELDNSLAESWTTSSDPLLGLSKLTYNPNVSLFPNPTSDFCIVESDQIITNIKLVNVSGRTIEEIRNVNSTFITLQVSDIDPGFYILNTEFAHGLRSSSKLIVYKNR